MSASSVGSEAGSSAGRGVRAALASATIPSTVQTVGTPTAVGCGLVHGSGRRGVGDDVLDLTRRGARAQRHERRPGAQDAEECRHRVKGGPGLPQDPVARADPAVLQHPGHAGRQVVELAGRDHVASGGRRSTGRVGSPPTRLAGQAAPAGSAASPRAVVWRL